MLVQAEVFLSPLLVCSAALVPWVLVSLSLPGSQPRPNEAATWPSKLSAHKFFCKGMFETVKEMDACCQGKTQLCEWLYPPRGALKPGTKWMLGSYLVAKVICQNFRTPGLPMLLASKWVQQLASLLMVPSTEPASQAQSSPHNEAGRSLPVQSQPRLQSRTLPQKAREKEKKCSANQECVSDTIWQRPATHSFTSCHFCSQGALSSLHWQSFPFPWW